MSQLDELRAEVVRLDAERDEARRQAEKAWGKIRENQELRDSADMEEAARLEALEPGLTKIGWEWRSKQEHYRLRLIPEARRSVEDCETEIKRLERSIANHEHYLSERGPFAHDRRKLKLALDGVDARERGHREKLAKSEERLQLLTGEVS